MAKFRIVIEKLEEVEESVVVEGIIRNTVARQKGKCFVATQNKHGLFKLGGKLKDRGFTRGERIAIARRCKIALQAFRGEQAPERELAPGTGIDINDVPIKPVEGSSMAADRRQEALRASVGK
ncbi:hypothetical protein CMI47_08025 [Candidatus Pacearchaeota archaeon]|jgi:hypothetical protein|nr:hypothetical protein [Candidatus Pacearchaeota archaeon]